MTKSSLQPQSKQDSDPMERANALAKRMANVLSHQDAADVSLAVALLTSGVIHQFAESLTAARDLIASIRRVEDLIIDSAFDEQHATIQ
jgi:hypothetical protein